MRPAPASNGVYGTLDHSNSSCWGGKKETPEFSAPSIRTMSYRGKPLEIDQPPKMDAVKEVMQ